MKYDPHEYQRTAQRFVEDNPRCCLFLDMGLGKTVITLSAIAQLLDDCDVDRVLVVAPKKVAEATWTEEANKWEHTCHLRISEVMGTPSQRIKALNAQADVYVLSRDSVVWLMNEKHPHFDMIVIDELTSFKSSSSKRSKAMRKLAARSERVVGLTGTPAPNGLIDLWGQMAVVDGGERLGKYVTHYREKYFNSIVHNGIPIKFYLKPGAEDKIREKLSDICLTMRAQDLLDMPQMRVVDVPVKIPHMQRYRKFEREQVMSLDEADITAGSAAALLNKLAQFANGAVYDDNGNVERIHTAKAERLREIVEEAASPVLVFYQFKHDVRGISDELTGVVVRKYEGKKDLDEWNAGKIDVLLAHPASTAYGLNMQRGGHTVVWYSTGWDLELYDQANARLYRQGQTQTVNVYRLIAQGTVDERAVAALGSKDRVQTQLVNSFKELWRKVRTTGR